MAFNEVVIELLSLLNSRFQLRMFLHASIATTALRVQVATEMVFLTVSIAE